MRSWLLDLRHGCRSIFRARAFAASAVGTMALAITALVTIFTVVDRVLLRPLPFDGSARVVQLCETSPSIGSACSASPLNVQDLARAASTLEAAGVARGEPFVAVMNGERIGIRGAIVSPGFFDVLAIRASVGRLFADSDLPRGANQVAIVSYGFWRDRLGGSPNAIGRTLLVDSREVRLIGVLPQGAYIPYFEGVQMWKPVTAGIDDAGNRAWRGFAALARVRKGVSRAAVDAELTSRYSQLAAEHPATNRDWAVRIENLRDRIVRPVRQPVLLFQLAVAMLLLIACANVAGLLLVRTAARDAEFAIRTALGAGRLRLARQMFAEGLAMSSVSVAIGLAGAAFALSALRALAPPEMPRLVEVQIDARIALIACAMAVVTAAAFSLVPVGRPQTSTALRAQRHGGSRRHLQQVFAATQLALALALLASAGLVTRAFLRLSRWEPGFDRASVQTSWLVAPPDRVGRIDAGVDALLAARAAVAALPGVEHAGLVSAGPLFGGVETGSLQVADQPDAGVWTVNWFDADEGLFPTLGITASRGRLIAATDTFGSERVAVVNDVLARQVFGGLDVVGRRIVVDRYESTIVGVVPAIIPAPGVLARPEVYWPIRQYRRYAAYLVIREARGAPPSAAAVRRALAAAVPVIDASALRPLESRFADALIAPRFSMWLALAFAIAAAAVAAVGRYAVIAAAVMHRRHEIGVRLALGASPGDMAAAFMRETLTLFAVGSIVGLALMAMIGRGLARVLHCVPPTDPVAIGAAFAVLAVAAVSAGYLPARRASQVDPLTTLRSDG